MDTWDLIADERRALAELLDGLDANGWTTPSLCAGWTVREVAAHLTVPFRSSTPALMVEVARSRFSFSRAMDRLAKAGAELPTATLVAALRDNATTRFTPPGLGPEAPLTDIVVHGLDIRRPLGIDRVIPAESIRRVLAFLTSRAATRGFLPRGRLRGLRLEAADLDEGWGDGVVIRGSAEDLALAAMGRVLGLEACAGDGVAVLSSRLA